MDKTEQALPVVSSLVIQVKPASMQAVTRTIQDIDHAEIHGTDGRSKIIVVIEAVDDNKLSAFMNKLGAVEGVMTVNMVFHHTDPVVTPGTSKPEASEYAEQ